METADLLTVDEVAKRLSCHPQTVRRFIWSGKLDHVKVGGLVRVPEAALERLLEESASLPATDSKKTGVEALRAVIRSRKASPEDVAELERLILEGERPAEWSSPI